MKTKIVLFTCLVVVALSLCQVALAHTGGLDSGGGHKDKRNVSGLGSYHYHCGDFPAHQHGSSGLCPYSSEYKAYKAIVDELKTYVGKLASDVARDKTPVIAKEDLARMETLLLNELMPFKLTQEVLSAEATLYGETNVKGLNVRKKPSTSSAKVCAISVTGTGLLIIEDAGSGWYAIRVFEDGKSQTGYVKTDMVDLIEKSDYLVKLCGSL